MKKVKLYGVGVGPGATDLMTLRSVNILNSVDVIAIPFSSKTTRPFAWRICSPVIKEREDQEKLFLHFPMTKDHRVLIPKWKIAMEEIAVRLNQGKSVAFITQGDPSVYSSWSYLLEASSESFKNIEVEVEVEVVPAVSSITAIPALLKIPLADGAERFCVYPATYGLADLDQIIKDFDSIILTKVGRKVKELTQRLESMGLLETASYVSYGTTGDQVIIKDLKSITAESCDYFSMVMISIRNRKGVLKGDYVARA